MSNGKQQNPMDAMMSFVKEHAKGGTTDPSKFPKQSQSKYLDKAAGAILPDFIKDLIPSMNQGNQSNPPSEGTVLQDKATGAQSVLDGLIAQYDLGSDDPEAQKQIFNEIMQQIGPDEIKNIVKMLKGSGVPMGQEGMQSALGEEANRNSHNH